MKKVGDVYTEDPIRIHFGLSYANWLVLPRVVLEAMPYEWQKKFVKLLDELDETYDWIPSNNSSFTVSMKLNGRYYPIPEQLANYRRPDKRWLEHIKINNPLAK